MSNLSNYAEKLVLDWLVTTGSVVRPTAWFLALFTSTTDDAGGGTELSGNGYAREAVICAAAATPSGGTQNTNGIVFTAVGGSWGTVSHIAIYDAVSGGNSLWHGPLVTPQVIVDGHSLVFTDEDLDFILA